jgi:hypothetical protein
MPTDHPWLYRWEAKGIQRYILQSNRLVHLRGASNAIVALGEEASDRAKAQGATVLQSTAGVGVYAFPTLAALRAFAEAWPMTVETAHCPGLQVAQGWLQASGHEVADLRNLVERVAADRNRPRASFPEPGPLVERAARTGRAATRRDDGEELDRALQKFAEGSAEDRDSLAQSFGFERGSDIEADLANWPTGYIAVVHADGNGVGARVKDLGLARLGAFSAALAEATQAAAKTAAKTIPDLQTWLRDDGRLASKLPFRPIVLGGDDITAIVPARIALDFTVRYLRAFEEETAKRGDIAGGEPLRAAAGIAFVNRKFPFSDALSLAEALVKGAKARSRDRSLLLFHRVTTTVSGEWSDIRDQELARGLFAFGPYSVSGDGPEPSVERLDKLRARMQGLPVGRGAFRGWAGLVSTEGAAAAGDDRAARRWNRIRELLGKRTQGALLDDALGALGVSADGFRPAAPGPRATPIYDALTLAALGVELHPEGR